MGKKILRTGQKGERALRRSAGRMAADLIRARPEQEALLRQKYFANKTLEQKARLALTGLFEHSIERRIRRIEKATEKISAILEQSGRLKAGAERNLREFKRLRALGKPNRQELLRIRAALKVNLGNTRKIIAELKSVFRTVPIEVERALKKRIVESLEPEAKILEQSIKAIDMMLGEGKNP